MHDINKYRKNSCKRYRSEVARISGTRNKFAIRHTLEDAKSNRYQYITLKICFCFADANKKYQVTQKYLRLTKHQTIAFCSIVQTVLDPE